MARIIYQLRGPAHSFGDEAPAGWIPPNAARPPRTPKRTVLLDISIEELDGGFILQWDGPAQEYSGDLWYQDLAYAEHAAEELFGVTRADWEPAV
jgi:hypothetical protein